MRMLAPGKVLLGTILIGLIALPSWSTEQGSASQSAMRKEAKVTMDEAQKAALSKEPGKIKSKELEREKGRLIYSFDIKMADGLHEVNVDATTGDIIEDTVESAAAEAKEKAADRKKPQSAPQSAPQKD
jgi:hypothetical protein